ncbi:MAG: metabolism ATPase/kinaselike protein [Crocinitomicaceae bacterium]|jgi:NadR type nicotinamide-nucleotide adenylyltransferase|nr:metabolism ATPase/kinaselike protein [Crocinitomicaceae bacterium]
MHRIGIIGPESSGKSELSQRLAKRYSCPWVPEYAREYLENLGRPYNYEDLEIIARKELNLIENCDKSNEFCFIDTELVILKVWSEFKYRKCCDFILENLDKQGIGFYLLCYPDIPWEDDPLRENPNDRLELFEIYEQELIRLNKKYVIIKGDFEERMAICEAFLDELVSR